MAKVVVTGGSGMLGRWVVRHFVEQGYEVVNVDTQKSPDSLCQTIIADLNNLGEVYGVLAGADAVVHLAAQTMVPYSIEHPDEDCEINLAGLINVLENCRKYKVKTVLFASSAAVYGNNENVPLHEDLALMPMSFYGITKMTSEHYLRV